LQKKIPQKNFNQFNRLYLIRTWLTGSATHSVRAHALLLKRLW